MYEFGQEYLEKFLIGPPVSRAKLRKLGISRYVPPIGATKMRCGRCSKNAWISQEQAMFLQEHTEENITCRCFCCVDLARSELSSMDGPPGAFYFLDGTMAGPRVRGNN